MSSIASAAIGRGVATVEKGRGQSDDRVAVMGEPSLASYEALP